MKRESATNSQAKGAQHLYRIGRMTAILMPIIIIIQMVAFISAPPPYVGTAIDWFNIFQQNPLVGLIDFEFLMVIYKVLSIAFLAAGPAFEMLYRSSGYATAAERAMFLAAREAKLVVFNGTAFHVRYLLGSLGGLIISLVMLQMPIFSKASFYIRMASSVCDLGHYISGIGIYISIFSVLFLLVWDILIARKLFQFGRMNETSRYLLKQEMGA